MIAKKSVPKNRLVAWGPDPAYDLDQDNVATLQHWLSVRYKRAAFPDEFNDRMKVAGIIKPLETIGKDHNAIISAIYFNLDPRGELAADDPTPYKLTITVLHLQAGDEARGERRGRRQGGGGNREGFSQTVLRRKHRNLGAHPARRRHSSFR